MIGQELFYECFYQSITALWHFTSDVSLHITGVSKNYYLNLNLWKKNLLLS